MKNILVLGATSAIAEEFIKINSEGNNLILIGRNQERLEVVSTDCKLRGALNVKVMHLELSKPQNIQPFFKENAEYIKNLDLALIASGTLPNQESLENDTSALITQLNINAISIICFINELLGKQMLKEESALAVITSVAGDRGRKSNYIYGAAKSSLSTYLEGLWHKLSNTGIRILDIKPGFVDTPMTKDFKKGALWSQPSTIAKIINNSIKKNQSSVIYAPFYWRIIMLIIKLVPNFIFRKLNL